MSRIRHEATTSLWADALSKGKQDLATSPPRMRGTPRLFLDSRSNHRQLSFTDHRLQARDTAHGDQGMMADEISSAASVLATNNINTIVAFICGGVFIVVIGFASKQLYTPETGVMRAFNGYKALCLSWDAVYARYTDAEQDEKMVDTKRKIDSAIEDLNEKISDLDTTVWWKKMHWGTSAARAYDEQHAKLKRTIDVFQSNAELRKTKHFPPPPAPTAV
ncbi:hypothetical protein B0H11DRAFT_1902569 [Mycena galericulata]|nr:hypothetical protein B0H11DRAFT_1902569 [Mycena galericulata]